MNTLGLKKYQGPFTEVEARLLLTRAGFGATATEITSAVGAGLNKTVARLFAGPRKDDRRRATWQKRWQNLEKTALRGDVERLQAMWLLSAVSSPQPLKERIALFWHDHFATANSKVQNPFQMAEQMKVFFDDGLGQFSVLLDRIAKNPAMLVYLDGDKNSKANPNENFAREVMELFTMGIGQYSEQDIKEAARAFTGWQISEGKFRWVPEAHDDGSKVIFGKRGRLTGENVLKLCADHDACAHHLASKLLFYFVGPSVSKRDIDRCAQVLRERNLDIGAFLNELFSSELFYRVEHRSGRIKSPIEFVVGALRAVKARFSATEAVARCRQMGQEIYDPPGVDGWPEGRAWINSTTIVARQNFASDCGLGRRGKLKLRPDASLRTVPGELSFAVLGRDDVIDREPLSVPEALGKLLASPYAQMI